MRSASEFDAPALASHWSWLIPAGHTPLLLSILGDWVFGAPDGSHWVLSTLEGSYEKVAENSAEFNLRKRSFEWLDKVFLASWQEIADRNGIVPTATECITWKVPPVIGGRFEVSNLCLLPQSVYQAVMSQLHQQAATGRAG
jgi:hypothetical protein